MFKAIENDVFVYFIADNNDIGTTGYFIQLGHVKSVHHCAGGVMRCVDDDHFGALANQLLYVLPVYFVFGCFQVAEEGLATSQFNGGGVTIISGGKKNYLIIFADYGNNGGKYGLGATCGNGNFGFGVNRAAV